MAVLIDFETANILIIKMTYYEAQKLKVGDSVIDVNENINLVIISIEKDPDSNNLFFNCRMPKGRESIYHHKAIRRLNSFDKKD
jgi:hypothetical protein